MLQLAYIPIFQKEIDLKKLEEHAVDFAKEYNAEYWSVSTLSGFVLVLRICTIRYLSVDDSSWFLL